MQKPFYDPDKTYEENFAQGPFGAFADKKVYEEVGEPEHDFLGHKVYLPFGIANGPLINGNFVKAALDKGFDIVEYKDVRSRKTACNPFPNIVPLKIHESLTLDQANKGLEEAVTYSDPISITNSFGIPSMDPDFWQKDLADAVQYARKGQIVIGGIQGTLQESGGFEAYLQDFITVARLLKETGVKVMELNLSCPNEGVANLLCFDHERSAKVVEKVKNEIGETPLIIKVGYFENQQLLETFVKKLAPFVQGIAAINTIPAKIFDKEGNQALPGENRLISGVCGVSIKWAGLDMVKRLKKIRKANNYTFSIEGVGGVTRPEDFKEYKKAGADTVMSATGAMWNPLLAQEIKNAL